MENLVGKRIIYHGKDYFVWWDLDFFLGWKHLFGICDLEIILEEKLYLDRIFFCEKCQKIWQEMFNNKNLDDIKQMIEIVTQPNSSWNKTKLRQLRCLFDKV